MIHTAFILLTAFVLDFLWGDPPYRLHPIRLLGSSVNILEKLLRSLGLSGLLGGMLLVTFVVGLSLTIYLAAHSFLVGLHPWLATILNIYLVYSCLALTDLLEHAVVVAMALEKNDLIQARIALQSIVGRDTSPLDSAGVARGAVESTAENFVDGVLSPIFWYSLVAVFSHAFGYPAPAAAGIVGMLGFKAISTLDSMVGYRSFFSNQYQVLLWLSRSSFRCPPGPPSSSYRSSRQTPAPLAMQSGRSTSLSACPTLGRLLHLRQRPAAVPQILQCSQ